jgi:hypothetical protein
MDAVWIFIVPSVYLLDFALVRVLSTFRVIDHTGEKPVFLRSSPPAIPRDGNFDHQPDTSPTIS